MCGVGRHALGHDGVDREHDLHATPPGFFQQGARGLHEVTLQQRLADAVALRVQEGVGHAAADQQQVHAREQVLQHAELARHLGAANHGGKRARGVVERVAERRQLLLHEQPGDGGQVRGHAHGRGVRAVRGAEGVIHVEIAQGGQSAGEGRVIGFLLGVEAQVLQ